jgi:hypothetical protein
MTVASVGLVLYSKNRVYACPSCAMEPFNVAPLNVIAVAANVTTEGFATTVKLIVTVRGLLLATGDVTLTVAV